MPLLPLSLVIIAAITHASWNLLAKRASDAKHFVFLFGLIAVVLWGPLAAVGASDTELTTRTLLVLVGSGVLHLVYSLVLQHAYKVGDLSVVYPVTRGTGPVVAFAGAVVILGERPSLMAVAGAVCVVAGVVIISLRNIRGVRGQHHGIVYGLVCGCLVASYTIWDGWAVTALLLPPLLVDVAGNALRVVVLSPGALRQREQVMHELRRYWREAVGVAVLGPLGYTLVLYATRMSGVTHVAPARELSMMVAAYLGTKVLNEGDSTRRLAASALIVTGVVALALA